MGFAHESAAHRGGRAEYDVQGVRHRTEGTQLLRWVWGGGIIVNFPERILTLYFFISKKRVFTKIYNI